MKSTEEVRAMLHEAFRDVPRITSMRTDLLDHRDLVELRRKLPRFVPEDMQYVLLLVLEDLLDTHTGDPILTEDAEFVLMHLNVEQNVPEATDRKHAEIWGDESVARERKVRARLRDMVKHDFDAFDSTQSRAIYQWLLLARSWPDFRDYTDDLDGALEYWRKRSHS